MKTPIPLRLVGAEAALADTAQEAKEDVLAVLVSWLGSVAGALPADAAVLARLWPHAPAPETAAIARAITRGCRVGRLRKVVIGKEPHLLLADIASESAPLERSDTQSDARDLEQEKFALRLEVDVEHERVLLYRILLVLGLIVGSLIARQAVFWWLGL